MRNIIKKAVDWILGRNIIYPPAGPKTAPVPLDQMVIKPQGSTLIWKITDAIVVTMARTRAPEEGWTAAALATAISACPDFAFECSIGSKGGMSYLKPEQVNAAISGISTRSAGGRARHWVTDVYSWEDPAKGLKTPWRQRKWNLTSVGRERAVFLIEARSDVVRKIDIRRHRTMGNV